MSPADLAAILDRGACAIATDPLQPRPGPGRRPAAVERAERDALAAEAERRMLQFRSPIRPDASLIVPRLTPEERRRLIPQRPRASLDGEDGIQQSICDFFDLQFLTCRSDAIFFSINNTVNVRVIGKKKAEEQPWLYEVRQKQLLQAKLAGGRLLAMGLLPGMTDSGLIWPVGQIAFPEIKRPGEDPDDHQIELHDVLRRYGFRVAVWRSLDHAITDARAWGAVPC